MGARRLAVVILGLFGLKAMRARKQNDFDDSLSRLAGAAAGADALEPRQPGDTQPLRAAQSRGTRNAFVVEESGTHERPRLLGGNDFSPAAAPRNVPADETISSETAINLDQGDPLAEADFHMAYGLYDQAADLVRIAIEREPERRDLKLKLLEIFFVWGNKDAFLQAARELAQPVTQRGPGEWEKIAIMGRQISPDDPMFTGARAQRAAPLRLMDLNLEGGENRVDLDLLGPPKAAAGAGRYRSRPGFGARWGRCEHRRASTVKDANLASSRGPPTARRCGRHDARDDAETCARPWRRRP